MLILPKTRQYFQIDRPDVADLTTTINDYVLVPFPLDRETTRNYWDTWHLAGVKLLRFSAADNNLKVKVMGSIDGTNFTETVEAEFSVTTATPVTKRILAYWPYLQVQVKPAVAAQHGTLSILAIGTAITAEADTELTASIDPAGLATEATAGDIKTAVEALAVATPDTTAGDLASISADLGIIQTDIATVKADIILIKADVAKLPQKVQLHANIDFSTASDQTIIAAPVAGNRIRLTRLSLSSGSDPQVNVEIALKSGATTIETVRGDAMVFDYPEHRNLGSDEAFVVQCPTADRVIGGVDYYIEAV